MLAAPCTEPASFLPRGRRMALNRICLSILPFGGDSGEQGSVVTPRESVCITVLSSASKGHRFEIAQALYLFGRQGTSEMLFLHCLLSHPPGLLGSTSNFSFHRIEGFNKN